MALINKIREKTGLAVGVIAFGLILFLLGGDILAPNSVLLGKNSNVVGEIAGEDIPLEEYQNKIEEMKYNFTLNNGRNPSDAEMNSLRQQAWDLLISQIAFGKQIDELGIKVTQEEIVDMVQGRNISPELQQAFTNPETGEFDREQIIAFLKNLDQMPAQNQAAWYAFERNLGPGRVRLKYDNLLVKTDYVTSAEAQKEHEAQNAVAEVRFLYVPFASVHDSLVPVNDSQLKTYLNKNKHRYQTEESRALNYVAFSISPSGEDTAAVKKEILNLKEDFSTVKDDSLFARVNSDGANYFNRYNPGELPEQLKANLSNLSKGDVRGPYLDNNGYVLYKVSDIYNDTIASARASHILFRADKNDSQARANAKKEAEDVLKQIQRGADFEEMAKKFSADPSSRRGGDLGWFSEGRMVKPFEDAVFKSQKGLVNRVVETDFGFHIIKVTEPKTNQAFAISTVLREIIASDETRDQAFRKADYFAASVSNLKEFDEFAAKEGYAVNTADNISTSDKRVGTLGDARELVRWAYNDASVGKVSQVFEFDDNYVVAALTDKVEAGTAPLEEVKAEITAKVKNEQKTSIIKEALQGKNGSLDEIAKAYGEDAKVYTSNDLKLSSNSIPTVGFAPVAIGTAFGLSEGQKSEPFAEESGIVIMELVNLTEAPEIADYSRYKNDLLQRISSRTPHNVSEAVKDKSNIEDKRYKFF